MGRWFDVAAGQGQVRYTRSESPWGRSFFSPPKKTLRIFQNVRAVWFFERSIRLKDQITRGSTKNGFLPLRSASDVVLLSRFSHSGDQEAFQELLSRHQSLAWGVCRRVLFDRQLAEDAFQITWLTLLRHGHSIRERDFGPWVYQVAFRTSVQIRKRSARELTETQMEGEDHATALREIAQREQQMIVEEEIDQLPEKYRAPIVMCHLQDLARDVVADHLQLTESAVKGRLERGRALLRSRLTRRGISIGVCTLVMTQIAKATPPPAELQSTITNNALQWQHTGNTPFDQLDSFDSLLKKDFPMKWSAASLQRAALAVAAVLLAFFVIRDLSSHAEAGDGDAENGSRRPLAGEMVQIQTESYAPLPGRDVEPRFIRLANTNLDQIQTVRKPELTGGPGAADKFAGNWTRKSILGETTVHMEGNEIEISFSGSAEIVAFSAEASGEFSQASDGTVYGLLHAVEPNTTAVAMEMDAEAIAMLGQLTDIPFSMRIHATEKSLIIKSCNIGLPAEIVEQAGSETVLYTGLVMQGSYSKDSK